MKFEEALALLRDGKAVRRGNEGDVLKLFTSTDGDDHTIQRERENGWYPWQPSQRDILAENYEEVTDAE